MNRIPETADDILKYFYGITYHGIDLSQVLTNVFSVDHMYRRLHKKESLDWIYSIFRIRFVNYFLARRWKNTKQVNLQLADYLLLTNGAERFTTLVFPVVERLQPETTCIFFLGSENPNVEPSCPSYNIEDIPYDFDEMQRGVGKFWRMMQVGLSALQKEFNLSNFKIYSVMSELTQAVATVLKAEYLLSRIKPSLVFTDNDHQHYSAIILQVAKTMGIPTATLVHGLQGKDKFDRSTWVPILTDKIIVWGSWMQKDFQDMGVLHQQIKVGGYPRLKSVTEIDKQKARIKLNNQGIPVNKKIVLLISSSHTEEKLAAELFFSTQGDLPDYVLMARPHPREQLSWYTTHLSGTMNQIQNPIDWSLIESLASSEIIIGSMSGAIIDAILLGKKVIVIPDAILNYSDRPMIQEGVYRGEVLVANNSQELIAYLKSGNDPERTRSQFAIECAEVIGDDAAILTADILKKMALTH